MTNLDIIIRLSIAVLIGLSIGFEREHHHRPAGMKTHIMVCVGATVVSLIQLKMIKDANAIVAANEAMVDCLKTDVGRMGAQVISGIGFLGAGTIIVKKGSVNGLTTASTLWLTACIGLAVGMGYLFIAIGSFIIVMSVLIILRFLQHKSFLHHKAFLEISFSKKKEGLDSVTMFCAAHGIEIDSVNFVESDEKNECFIANYTMQIPRNIDKDKLKFEIIREPFIEEVNNVSE